MDTDNVIMCSSLVLRYGQMRVAINLRNHVTEPSDTFLHLSMIAIFGADTGYEQAKPKHSIS